MSNKQMSQRTPITDNVLIFNSLKFHVTSAFLVVGFMVILGFATQVSYNKTATVEGTLVLDGAVSRITAASDGTLNLLAGDEGEQIEAGQIIAEIQSANPFTLEGEALNRKQVQIRVQLEELKLQRERTIARADVQFKIDSALIETLLVEIVGIEEILELKVSEFSILQRRYDAREQLALGGSIPVASLEDLEVSLLNERQSQLQLQASIAAKKDEVQRITLEMQAAALDLEIRISSLNQEISQVENDLEALTFTNSHRIEAPKAGSVASIFVEDGDVVAAGTQILTLVPTDVSLIAELHVPPSSFGYLALGDEVRISVDAFPYERFGYINGTIVSMDEIAVRPQADGVDASRTSSFYRVRAIVPQGIDGRNQPYYRFSAGMTLSSPLVLERRSLFDWLARPIKAAFS